MSNNKSVILFRPDRPDAFFKSQLYDPDIDGPYTDELGKIIPHPGSIIVDDIAAEEYNIYQAFVVVKVDDLTYKSTLKPLSVIVTNEDDDDKDTTSIISYGNEKFMLYYDDRIKPVKLYIDSKLIIFGNSNVEYRLVRTTGTDEQEIISVYVDSNETINGNRIPLMDIGNSGAKWCTNCHTLSEMKEGDLVYLEIFNSAGALTAKISLFTKRSIILNDLTSFTNPIVYFDAVANQMRGDDFYVYEKQDPHHIGITPIITYADGTEEIVTVDNKTCFVYGLDDFIPSYSGFIKKILIKKFLNYKQLSTIDVSNGKERYIYVEKNLIVLSNKSKYSLKLSVIPKWDSYNDLWYLQFYAYISTKDKAIDVTAYITYESTFDGTLFNKYQRVIVSLDTSTLFNLEIETIYRQEFYILLRPYNLYEKYLIKDSSNDEYVYGVETTELRRPIIHYDSIIEQYFIPTSRFSTKEIFVEAFYKMARPPYDPEIDIDYIKPTHFTLRNSINGFTLLTIPVPIDEYEQAFNINVSEASNMLVNSTVIVEFLQYINDEYKIIYGVPVDVRESETGYNTEENP